jgi:hypothetical protein
MKIIFHCTELSVLKAFYDAFFKAEMPLSADGNDGLAG